MTARHQRKNKCSHIRLPGSNHPVRRPLHHRACHLCQRAASPHDRREMARLADNLMPRTRDRQTLARD